MKERARPGPALSRLACALATVGGIGQWPWGPGTWGSAVGLLIGMTAGRWVSYAFGVVLVLLALPVCAVVCTEAEQALGRHDAPAIVLDEVWAMASILILLPWAMASWRWLVTAFVLFRVFDITKPWPLRLLARLPEGWGVMMDDAGAAIYAGAILYVFQVSSFKFQVF